VQAQVGMHPDETLADGVIRTEALCDLGYPDWRDRPAIERSNDVFLCGDSVAAPSLLSEVSWSSAVTAAEGALRAVGREVIHI
jgi:hypothetical protein